MKHCLYRLIEIKSKIYVYLPKTTINAGDFYIRKNEIHQATEPIHAKKVIGTTNKDYSGRIPMVSDDVINTKWFFIDSNDEPIIENDALVYCSSKFVGNLDIADLTFTKNSITIITTKNGERYFSKGITENEVFLYKYFEMIGMSDLTPINLQGLLSKKVDRIPLSMEIQYYQTLGEVLTSNGRFHKLKYGYALVDGNDKYKVEKSTIDLLGINTLFERDFEMDIVHRVLGENLELCVSKM